MPLNVTRDHLISLLKHFKPIIELHYEKYFLQLLREISKSFHDHLVNNKCSYHLNIHKVQNNHTRQIETRSK